MIQRKAHNRHAPIPSNDYYDRTETVKTIFRHSQRAEWKPEPYTKMLYDHMFKRWK